MSCPTCLDNCDPLVTDKCTKYTGPDIEALGICKGMSLFEVEEIILAKLIAVTDPTQFNLETLTTTCSFITTLLVGKPSQPFSIQEFAEIVFDGLCKLDTKIATVDAKNPAYSYNVGCLTGTITTKEQLLQALITQFCVVSSKVATLESTTVKTSDLCAQVQACLDDEEDPIVVPSTDFNLRMVPFTYVPYAGPLNNFDNTGKGIAANGFDKIYLANGLNGTQDWRGYSPVGAIQNVPGSTLDSRVDPSVPANIPYNYTMGNKYGNTTTTLNVNQIPAHNHILTDPGHKHNFGTKGDRLLDIATNAYIVESNPDRVGSFDANMQTAQTGITLQSTGGSQAHPNIQPVVACSFIVYIP